VRQLMIGTLSFVLTFLGAVSCGGQTAHSTNNVPGDVGATSESEGGSTSSSSAGGSIATGIGGIDTSTLPEPSTPEECDAVEYPGTVNSKTFAEALVKARQNADAPPSQRFLLISGMADTWALGCFDGLIDAITILGCGGGAFQLRKLPQGTRQVRVQPDCPLLSIDGVAGASTVELYDVGGVTDFSALEGASSVYIRGYPSLELVGLHVLRADTLSLDVSGTTLSPLNGALASELSINIAGAVSIAGFEPGPNLTCFDIKLEDLSIEDSRTEVASLCTAERNGKQCPDYNDCFGIETP
jgi:hypothetical protein